MEAPLISVITNTYNHHRYIRQAIESVLMQETTFPIEYIIGEDESSDGTREICQEYEEKYPDRIRLFLRSRKDVIYINGSPTARFNIRENIRNAKGKYIAILPGDDYWLDPKKLQKQVELLESEENLSAVVHPIVHFKEMNDSYQNHEFQPENRNQITINELALRGCIPHISSLVFRKSFLPDFPEWLMDSPTGDYPIMLILAGKSPFRVVNEYMSVYRVHPGGVWSKRKEVARYISMLKALLIFLNQDFEEDVNAAFRSQFVNHFKHLIQDVLYDNDEQLEGLFDLMKTIPSTEPLNHLLLLEVFESLLFPLKNGKMFRTTNKIKEWMKKLNER